MPPSPIMQRHLRNHRIGNSLDTALSVVSLNVNGLTHYVKRKKILTYLKPMHPDMSLIQETHLTDKESEKLRRDWVGREYHAHKQQNDEHNQASGNAQVKGGGAILLRKGLPAKIHRTWRNPEGYFVIIKMTIQDQTLIVGSVYCPIHNKQKTFQNLSRILI